MRLKSGNRVCIVGGGPAGSFAAIHLLCAAEQAGITLDVLVFEPRDFTHPGPRGCNRCAGIISSQLLRGLAEYGIQIPKTIIQSYIQSYTLHFQGDVTCLEQPDPTRQIISVYRGGGPRLGRPEDPSQSFDHFLLQQAQQFGAHHIPLRVRWVHGGGERPVLVTAHEKFVADLVVIATGVNSYAPLEDIFGYHPPPTRVMAQDEIFLPPEYSQHQVQTYFQQPQGLDFGALIPKGRYISISLLGRKLSTEAVEEFLYLQGLEAMLDHPESLCGCTPRIVVGSARNYFGNRWVAVGDAAVSRLYKDGIGSAFRTSRVAMHTVIQHGISKRDFRRHYLPYCRRLARDNRYGWHLFRMWSWLLEHPKLLQLWMNAIQWEETMQPEKRIHLKILWGMFTGDEPYRRLFWMLARPTAWLSLFKKIGSLQEMKDEQ